MNTEPPSPVAQRVALFDRISALSAETTLQHFRTGMAVENKAAGQNGFDPVTIADRNCERALRELLADTFPKDGIFGEEYGAERLDAEFVWVIDPIDGTRAFVSGVPLWGTLVGLLQNGRPVAGAGIQPFIGETFANNGGQSTWSLKGATRTLQTRACSDLASAHLMTTTPALFSAHERSAYDVLENATQSVRFGTDWYGYALIAAGTADIVVESGLALYDIAALIPIIEGAGGCVTDWAGERLNSVPSKDRLQVVAVGDPSLLPSVIEVLAPSARHNSG